MAQPLSSGSTTTTLESSNGREATLILKLRHSLANVEKNICSSIPEVAKQLNADIKGSKDKYNEQTIKASLQKVRAQYDQQLERIQADILALAPKKPVPEDFKSEEEFKQKQQQFEKELKEYSDFVNISLSLVKSVVKLITTAIDKLTQYSNFVWDLIKAKDPDMDKKCKDELKKMADEIHSATDSAGAPETKINA